MDGSKRSLWSFRRSLVVKLLIENIFIERLGFRPLLIFSFCTFDSFLASLGWNCILVSLPKLSINQFKPVKADHRYWDLTVLIYILWVQYFFSPCHTSKLCDMSAQCANFCLNFFPIKKDFCMCESIFFWVNLIVN